MNDFSSKPVPLTEKMKVIQIATQNFLLSFVTDTDNIYTYVDTNFVTVYGRVTTVGDFWIS